MPTSEPSPGSVSMAFREMRRGGSAAIGELWQVFFPRLVALANKTLAGRPQRVADAHDAAQSAFMSFYQRAVAGEFGDLLQRDELWNLLGVITARKALKQARREGADKRGGGKVVSEGALAAGELKLEDLAAQLPVQEMDLCCQELIDGLDDSLRPYALLRLLGYKNREIAEQFDCTERKVERKLQLIRMKWESELN